MSPDTLGDTLPPWEKNRATNAWWRLFAIESAGRSQLARDASKVRRWSLPALFRCDEDNQMLLGTTAAAKTWEKHYQFFLSRFKHADGNLPPSWSRLRCQQQLQQQQQKQQESVQQWSSNSGNRPRTQSASLWGPSTSRHTSDSSIDGVFSMDSNSSDSGCTSTAGSELFPPIDPDKLLRLAFTEYHNSSTFAEHHNTRSAFLGEKLSFHHAGPVAAMSALASSSSGGSCCNLSAYNPCTLRKTGSCSVIDADLLAVTVSTSPTTSCLDSCLTSTECDEPWALGYDECAASMESADGSKWVQASNWGRINHSDTILQPCSKVQVGSSGTVQPHQHPSSWVIPGIAAVLSLLNPPVSTVIAPGLLEEGLCAGSFDPAVSYRFEKVQVAAQLGRGVHSSYGPEAWAPRTLVLMQNFLLEYDSSNTVTTAAAPAVTVGCNGSNSSGSSSSPIGFAALCDARVSRWSPCVVRVDANTSCNNLSGSAHNSSSNSYSSSGKRELAVITFFIRGANADVADTWQAVLTAAAGLTLDSMFETHDSSSSGGRRGSSSSSRTAVAAAAAAAAACAEQHSDSRNNSCENFSGGGSSSSSGSSCMQDDCCDGGHARLAGHHTGPGMKQTLSQATLGHGRFASVRQARRVRGGRSCALKLFDKAEFTRRVALGQERADTLTREAYIQALLTATTGDSSTCSSSSTSQQCPIVKLLSVFETREAFVLEMELMSHTNMFHKLAERGPLDEYEAATVVKSLLESVAYCQDRGIAHRDIKLSNILCPAAEEEAGYHCYDSARCASSGSSPASSSEQQDGSKIVVRLADFGMGGVQGSDGMLRGRCGTPGYVAPEILRAGPQEPYPLSVDTYSVGVVAYTLLCGYEPFYGETDAELIAANKEGAFEFEFEWASISLSAQDLVASLMDPDPAKRLTAKQALQHPWLLTCQTATGNGCGNGYGNGFGNGFSDSRHCQQRLERCESYATTTEGDEDDNDDGMWTG